MNNTTNHVTNTLFTKKNEERIVAAFERLVDHITYTATPREKDLAREIKILENQLAEAHAKLSGRL